MKKILILLVFFALCSPALAAFQGPMVQDKFGTVQDVAKAPDDAYLCLEGNVINQVKHDKFTFQDGTGSIVVEIKPKYFGAVNITPANKVRICGEVDKEYLKRNEFEVKSIQVLQ